MKRKLFGINGIRGIANVDPMTCDGILTALQVLAIMKQKERQLDELARIMEPFPQVLYNVKVKEKRDFSEFQEIRQRIKRD